MNLAIEIPDNIFFGINQSKQSLVQLLKKKLALELYASHQISMTQGAKMLFMDFISKNIIADYDILEEVSNAKRILK